MNASAPQLVKRSRLSGALLRPLGHPFWGAEQTISGVTVLGGKPRQVAFSDMLGPAELTKALGFSGIRLPLKDGTEITIAGLNENDALGFISSVSNGFRKYFLDRFAAVEEELRALGEVVQRLEQPRRYPSACLLCPFVERVRKVAAALPGTIPEGVLPTGQQVLLDRVLALHTEPERNREAAVERFIATELEEMEPFFDQIESNPLTPEQRLAVVTDEDATLVLAGAGSGKTSVIVAKAAYLIERGIRQPEEILLMAFGKDAADEMASRIKERSGASVDALTFHALGYGIIRDVEGGTPALAAHASDDAQFRALLRDILINDVAKNSKLGKLILEWFSAFYWPYKSEWDFETKGQYYQYVESHELRTLKGDVVNSFEEWEIANWLYLNGVAYEYEPLYEHRLPKNDRKAYTPDFRLTESGVYIEHFGVRKSRGADGSTRLTTAPHVDREKYLEDMSWKRGAHKEYGTTLIETFSYEKVEGRLTEALREKIAPYVELKPIPPDQALTALTELGQVDTFTQTLATFLRHFKSSGTSIEQCHQRSEKAADVPRSNAFLKIFEPLFAAYQERLGERIDFEDMIIRAAEHVEAGRYQSPYRHLLVDEFQDISEGRARLLRALKAQHDDARIFAVGDDWQSIYRFTGSDIHLMRNFGEEFGGSFAGTDGVHRTVDLGRTFRSVDKIALPARRFVLQNPSQIEKKVVTASTALSPAINVAYYTRGQDEGALTDTLGRIAQSSGNKTSVLLLGRYHHLRPKSLKQLTANHPNLSIRFMTAHASKGLEADHVIILRAASDRMGFPSEIVDDPLLDLVLPKPEKFDHAEERRLFYVALTRARKSVTILADREKTSVFVRELIDEPAYETIEIGEPGIAEHRCGSCGDRMLARTSKQGRTYYSCEHRKLCGETLPTCSTCNRDLPLKRKPLTEVLTCSCGSEFPACPECDGGWLVERKGRYGKFLSCVRYPDCKGKRTIREESEKRG
ncbi:UvrD-helicase domain-containing protein [Ruegeria sp. HKCCA4812]|uniref:UvrD-helicase domain-containing protein n=1 Tax=Ruegeria sp. HKCCA4812 TaxID=2682993 RepID=UPI001487EB9F|nr:UvrD-helicase domain-containing protein [Ruegeria sp. HKCCA4812]